MGEPRSGNGRTLDERDLRPDPVEQFRAWFGEAVDAGLVEPNACALATASVDRRPSVRIVLLKGFGADGFVFATNYESRKGGELDSNPWAALCFHWQQLERQVRIEGRVERLADADSDEVFHSRPRLSRLGAWASAQSRPLPGRQVLEDRLRELDERYPDAVPRPSFWGGYRIRPDHFEFWQGRAHRLHDRFVYRAAAGGGWRIERLAP